MTSVGTLCIALIILIMAIRIDGYAKSNTSSSALSGAGCIVLTYHRVLKNTIFNNVDGFLTNNSQLTTYNIYANDFAKQIEFLRSKKVDFITAENLYDYIVKKRPLPSEKCILITFDDVDQSVFQNAFPILKKYNIPFVVFPILGRVGENDYHGIHLMSWNEIDVMKESGLATFGAHTYDMHYIESDGKPPFLNGKISDFQKDDQMAIKTFETHFGTKPRYFAYPYGFGTPQTDNILQMDGYKLIFTLRYGVDKPGDPAFFMKRILLTYRNWSDVKHWVSS